MLIHGDLYFEIKCLSTIEFTKCHDNPQELIENKKYFPCILIATASCIKNFLDYPDVRTVIHVGFPTSVVDAMQEIGQCRQGNADDESVVNKYIVLSNLPDFIYLNNRLYEDVDKDVKGAKEKYISYEDNWKQQHKELIEILKTLILTSHCVDKKMKKGMNLFPPQLSQLKSCSNCCHKCNNENNSFIRLVWRDGLRSFIALLFITFFHHKEVRTYQFVLNKLKNILTLEKPYTTAHNLINLLQQNIFIHFYCS